MSYSSKYGRRPNEYASKSSHGYIIQDKEVSDFLNKCNLPKSSEEIDLPKEMCFKIDDLSGNPIKHIVAVDGGYNEVAVKKDFPSSTLTFFQFGALVFSVSDLKDISEKNFIDPEDISKLNNIERVKLALPTKNIILKGCPSFKTSLRETIHNFFANNKGKSNYLETLKWFVFEEYLPSPSEFYVLASCPECGESKVHIERKSIDEAYSFKCPKCGNKIFLTDVFRLYEAIDEELGASGISGYLTILVEQIIIIDLIRVILNTKSSLLDEILIIKDGPLAFFGQTANMHKLMRKLTNFLIDSHNLFLIGLEKSGAFVEHASEIAVKLEPGSVLLLNNDYIYKYIIPGKADSSNPYARTSYYGAKLIFKSKDDKVYVATLPTKDANVILNPKKSDFHNIDVILGNVEKLKCDMYDNALFPVALANKLVSLADHPSARILEKFAKQNIK
ncbi:MAG: DNA double-strand break repair nuclease NurA [Desulfobacterales bacterium]|jgi:predicted RNA-binding Zn-ribbon protein involved in translation (DUF1610 family)|nr:DNA double-strand break repair nuclease NurA [Desulfobacterales bacterium]